MLTAQSAAASYWRQFTPNGQFWLTIGVIVLAIDMAMSFKYGWSQTGLHALGFAAVAFLMAFLPDAAVEEWTQGRKVASMFLWVVACPFLIAVALYSHIGYGAGVRVGDIQQTGFQNTVAADARKTVADGERNLKMWRERLDTLTTQNAWAPATKAEGLRAQMDSAQKAIDLETARGGCKAKCLGLMQDKAKLEERIAIVEQANELTRQIEATQKLVDKSRKDAAGQKIVSSAVVNQNSVAASMWLAVNGHEAKDAIDPDSVTTSFINIFINLGGAIAFIMMAPIAIYLAGRNRVAGHVDNLHQLTTGFTRGRAPDAETAQAGNHRAVVIERTIDDTQFIRLIAQARRQAA